ncbi:MAG: NAD(P)/FAD-dependent oxidoreductase [Chloroflexota bacterium]|jgi:nitrite reductase (NADH) large subunit
MRHLIIGNGPAGISAAITLRRIAPDDEVAIVSDEAQPFYSKVLTSYYVGGKIPYENMLLATADQLKAEGLQLLSGKRAVKLDTSAREVVLSGDERIQYDRLLIATGAEPFIPPIEGLGAMHASPLPGVFTLWTHDDAVKLEGWTRKGNRAVVVGAGLVGLKAAEAFLMKGMSATVIEMLDRVLPLVLSKDDAAIVQRALEQRGLSIRTGIGLTRILGGDRVQQVELSDGSRLDCDVVVIATGVRPNLALAKPAGIAFGRGILVNEFMETNVPGIYAAGDVAEGWDLARGRKFPNPTWGNASEQGRVAAYNMAGHKKPFRGAVTLNTFTFLGFSMAAVGVTQPEGDFLRVEKYYNPESGDYRKLIMFEDRLVGGVAAGDIRMAGVWRWLIAKKAPAASVASALLPGKTNFASTHGFLIGR